MTGFSSGPVKERISFFISASFSRFTFAEELREYFRITYDVLNLVKPSMMAFSRPI